MCRGHSAVASGKVTNDRLPNNCRLIPAPKPTRKHRCDLHCNKELRVQGFLGPRSLIFSKGPSPGSSKAWRARDLTGERASHHASVPP